MSDSLLSVEPSFNTEFVPDEPKKRNKGKDYKLHSEHPDEDTAVSLITSSAGFEGYCWRLLITLEITSLLLLRCVNKRQRNCF